MRSSSRGGIAVLVPTPHAQHPTPTRFIRQEEEFQRLGRALWVSGDAIPKRFGWVHRCCVTQSHRLASSSDSRHTFHNPTARFVSAASHKNRIDVLHHQTYAIHTQTPISTSGATFRSATASSCFLPTTTQPRPQQHPRPRNTRSITGPPPREYEEGRLAAVVAATAGR